jgi:hypothetical protein
MNMVLDSWRCSLELDDDGGGTSGVGPMGCAHRLAAPSQQTVGFITVHLYL